MTVDPLLVVVKFLHLFFSVAWIGSAFCFDVMLFPALNKVSPNAKAEVIKALMPVAQPLMTVLAILTLVSGIGVMALMGVLNGDVLLKTAWGGLMLASIGVIMFVIVAVTAIMAVTGKELGEVGRSIAERAMDGKKPKPELLARAGILEKRIMNASLSGLILGIVTLLFMSYAGTAGLAG